MNVLRDCFILWGPGSGWNFIYHNGMLGKWEDNVVETRSHAGGNNNQTWVGWRKLEWSLSNAPNSTMRRGGNNRWGSSPFFSPHIIHYLQSLVQRNLNKGIGGGRLGHFLLQLSLSFRSHFQPPTLNPCSCRACKSFHERGLNTLPQGNLQGVVFRTIEVLATLEKMGEWANPWVGLSET